MKMVHVADAHWGLGYPGPRAESRFNDINRVMTWVAESAIDEGCDIVLFAGDAFKDSKVFLDRAAVEIKAFAEWLRKLSSAGIPVVAISGTPSHDAVPAYELIKDMNIPNVHVMTRPGIVEVRGLSVACLPGVNRSHVATREECQGFSPREVHQLMTERLRDICYGLRAQGGQILLSHMTLSWANTGFDDFLLEHEPVLTQDAAAAFPLVCLGHIHKPQKIECGSSCTAFYPGTPERLSFNDEGIYPGFWIHDTETMVSTFVETPARPFVTLCEPLPVIGSVAHDVKDAIVRCRFRLTEEAAAGFDRRAYEKALYDEGAFFVSEVRLDVEKASRSRDEGLTVEGITPIQAVERWAATNGIDRETTGGLVSATLSLLAEVGE